MALVSFLVVLFCMTLAWVLYRSYEQLDDDLEQYTIKVPEDLKPKNKDAQILLAMMEVSGKPINQHRFNTLPEDLKKYYRKVSNG